MKKSSFIAMILGTISGLLFALGMCMALLPEWKAFNEGIIFGTIGIIMGIITFFVWRKMAGKAPIKLDKKLLLFITLTIVGALVLGIGMCLCIVYNKIVLGTIIGIVGIIILLCLIPLMKGVK